MSTRFNYVPNRIIDTDGISDGASVHFYLPGTTEHVDLFLDAEATIAAQNPYFVPAGAAVPPLYYTEGAVRVRIETTSGDIPFDEDPYVPFGAGGDVTVSSTGFLYVHDYYQEADGATDKFAVRRGIIAAAGSGKTLVFAPGQGHAEPGFIYDRDGDTLVFNDWVEGDYVFGEMNQNVDPTLVGNLKSNVNIWVPQGTTCWHQPGTTYMFYYNPVGIGTVRGSPNIVNVTDATALKNVTIRIDGNLRGNNIVEGFEEGSCLIFISGSSDITVHGTGALIGQKGDALQAGSGDVGPFDLNPAGAKQIRHNRNWHVHGLTFDGVNKNNRQSISVIDVDGMLVENCVFKNTSRPGNGNVTPADPYDPNTGFGMPGFFDVEGNIFSMPYIVCRNITLRGNKFINGGSGGVVFNLTPNTYVYDSVTYTNTNPTQNLVADNNYFDQCLFAFSCFGDTEGDRYNISFRNNTVQDCDQPFRIMAGKGVELDNNVFLRCDLAGYLGFALGLEKGLEELSITRNTFELCGNSIGAFQTADNIKHFKWNENTFKDCAGYAFSITGVGTTEQGEIKRNRAIVTPGAAKLMEGVIAYLTFAGTPTLVHGTITEEGNDWGGLDHFQFIVNGSKASVPPAGTFYRGNYVADPKAPPGEAARLDCIYDTTGAANPDAWAETLKPGGKPDVDWTPSWTITKSAGMTESADGRFTNTGGGTQWAYTAATLAQSPGAELIIQAPRTGWSGISVGFTDAGSIDAADDITYAVLFDFGQIFGTVLGGLYGPGFTPEYNAEWMQKVRVTMISNVVNIYLTDPLTGVEDSTPIYTSSFIGAGAVRMGVVITNEGQSVQVTKFGAP